MTTHYDNYAASGASSLTRGLDDSHFIALSSQKKYILPGMLMWYRFLRSGDFMIG